VTLARDTVTFDRIRRLPKTTIVALAAGFIAVGAALSGAGWESYRTSQREAQIFASLSAEAFKQGFCDRALRLAVAGLPPVEGASPLSFRSPVLQGELSLFGSMRDCHFQLALAGHTGLASGAAFSTDGTRIVTASWEGRQNRRLARHARGAR
jgi:hypothetical protein